MITIPAHHAIGAASLALAALLLPVASATEPDTSPLIGTYVVVGVRAASDVAAPLGVHENDTSKALIGTTLSAGDSISWYRNRCALRSGSEEPSAALVERNLADLQIVTASPDSRLNRNLILDCLGRAPNDIWQILAVDARVLVARTTPFTTYLILEQPLAPGDVKLLKERLARAGFDPGSENEEMDDSTRAAIAAFAHKNGAPAILLPGIVTENLLNALAAER